MCIHIDSILTVCILTRMKISQTYSSDDELIRIKPELDDLNHLAFIRLYTTRSGAHVNINNQYLPELIILLQTVQEDYAKS